MTTNDKDQNLSLDDIKAGPDSDTLLDPDLTMECMHFTMSYYITLSKIIDRKFIHARKAIQKRLTELEAEQAREKKDNQGELVQLNKIRKYKALNSALKQLSNILEMTQLGVDELEKIHEIFGLLPGKIKIYFDYLVSLDEELTEMTREISSEEYQAAYKRAQRIIDLVQEGKNVLSGRPVAEEQSSPYNIDEVLQVLRSELHSIKGQTKDGYSVLPDGSVVKEI